MLVEKYSWKISDLQIVFDKTRATHGKRYFSPQKNQINSSVRHILRDAWHKNLGKLLKYFSLNLWLHDSLKLF